MRVLTIANCELNRAQGSGYVILGFVDGLRQQGWQVDVFGPEDYIAWPRARRARQWRVAVGMLLRALRCLRRTEYDVVEFYGGEAWLAISALAARRSRRFLLVSHSNGLEPHLREARIRNLGHNTFDGKPRRWFQLETAGYAARGFRLADGLVTVSQNEREYALAQAYQPASRLLAIDNPLGDSLLSQPVALDRSPSIVYCGSWIAGKGAALMSADLPRVLRDFPRVRLRLIGVGSTFRAADAFPFDVCSRVEVVPFVSDKATLCSLLRQASISILPSAYESFGLAAAEAMACGCALVASRTGFAAGLQDGVECRLLESLASPSLYTALSELLCDEGRRRSIAENGFRRVQCLRWAPAVNTLAAAYTTWLLQVRALAPQR